MIEHVTPALVAERLRSDDPPLLVDVREPWEHELAAVPDAVLIPMGQIPQRLAELPHDRAIALMCHHGSRSLQVAVWLHEQGYGRLSNTEGGIDEWSLTVDPGIPRY